MLEINSAIKKDKHLDTYTASYSPKHDGHNGTRLCFGLGDPKISMSLLTGIDSFSGTTECD